MMHDAPPLRLGEGRGVDRRGVDMHTSVLSL